MKLKAASLFLGLCVAIMAVAASPAYARSTTGFSAFHVEVIGTTTTDAYLCIGESNGAVINNCSGAVNLEFDLPIDNQGTHWMTLQSFWGIYSGGFTCTPYAYDGNGNGYPGVGVTFQPGTTVAYPNVATPNGGESIQLICWGVPHGAGIANINWTP